MEMNENLAAVHAYLCADGYVVRNLPTQKHKYYRAGLRNQNLILLKDFQERFEKVFGVKPRLVEGERCEIGSREIYERLTKEFGSFYSWHWKMPEMKSDLLNKWLRAFFDCEGWVTCKSRQNRQIGVDCVNWQGLNQVKEALLKLGIDSKIKKRKTRDICHLSIYRKENIRKFMEKIGFLHPEKADKLKKAMEDFVEYKWQFPKEDNKIREFVKQMLILRAKIKKCNGTVRVISKEENNLLRLKKEMERLMSINSRVNKSVNGIGTVYFELDVNEKEQVKKLAELGFLNKTEKEKWMKLKK